MSTYILAETILHKWHAMSLKDKINPFKPTIDDLAKALNNPITLRS